MDLAVKYRLFRAFLCGGDVNIQKFYCDMIRKRVGHRWDRGLPMDVWKRSPYDYVLSARSLLDSMIEEGFRTENPVPLDMNRELLDGSHRVACALALGYKKIPITQTMRWAWAPAWGRAWFGSNGYGTEVIKELQGILAELGS